jgi:saccharopine dehydrogenase-like NADP-dependent oxidoreductase
MFHKILVVGLGDLAERIVTQLATAGGVELVLAARRTEVADALARFASSLGDCPARGATLNALDHSQVAELVARERPELIVQCASLVSPWA